MFDLCAICIQFTELSIESRPHSVSIDPVCCRKPHVFHTYQYIMYKALFCARVRSQPGGAQVFLRRMSVVSVRLLRLWYTICACSYCIMCLTVRHCYILGKSVQDTRHTHIVTATVTMSMNNAQRSMCLS